MKRMVFSVVLLAATALTGCGSSIDAAATVPTPTPTPTATASAEGASPSATPTASPEKTVSERGAWIKKPGQSAGMTNRETGKYAISFKVNSITADYQGCPDYKPKNGTIVVFDIDLTTTEELGKMQDTTFSFNSNAWKVIGPDGKTVNGDPLVYGCLDRSQSLLGSFGPAEKASGKLAFDVPAPSGTIVFSPGLSGGWEWAYPAK